MPTLVNSLRSAAVAIAALFIGLSLLGIFGVWWVEHRATEIALKGFGLVETGVGVVDAGVARVDDLITTSRTEVSQAAGTIAAVGTRARANTPVLDALSERLETSLAPRIAQIQKVLAPVRDAVRRIADAVGLLNSVPGLAERAPRLAALDETFNRLEELAADARQLRGTLRALVAARADELPAATVATLNGLTERIDGRLSEVQARVGELQAEVDALQLRVEARKARLLFAFNLLALVATLMLAWILYSQTVVIRHHRRKPIAALPT